MPDPGPGPAGDTTYKYIGAFLNFGYIKQFSQVTSNKFIFVGELWEFNVKRHPSFNKLHFKSCS